MSKMKELYTEENSVKTYTAECAKCGDVIEFSTNEEFSREVDNHIHRY
jgi:hypothetical protein